MRWRRTAPSFWVNIDVIVTALCALYVSSNVDKFGRSLKNVTSLLFNNAITETFTTNQGCNTGIFDLFLQNFEFVKLSGIAIEYIAVLPSYLQDYVLD